MKYTFRRFFKQNYQSTQPSHFSSQHIGDLQLNLNLQCVEMKNYKEGLIDNFVEKSGGMYIL